MEKDSRGSDIYEKVHAFLLKCICTILSIGPVPGHIGFIMDGNRRHGKMKDLREGEGHRAGYLALMSMLKYCYGLGVKYVTVYAFSIDNFKRGPEEVHSLMELMREKIEGLIKEESIVNRYGVRVHFIGDLKLLSESVRLAAERAMLATANNSKAVLSICVAYTSTNEILHALQDSFEEKLEEAKLLDASGARYGLIGLKENAEVQGGQCINLVEIEKNMYMSLVPDPDILVRTSGETRLSNFLLWQTTYCLLYSPSVLWPEIGFRHLVWAVLNFQRHFKYLQKKKKQL